MANVQLENGHLRIANSLYEGLLRADLTLRQQTVFLAVLRLTYGYRRKMDRVAASQIAELTGIEKANVRHALRDLTRFKMLHRDGKSLGPEKDVDAWVNRHGSEATRRVGGDPGAGRRRPGRAGRRRPVPILKTDERQFSKDRERAARSRGPTKAPETLPPEGLQSLQRWCGEKRPDLVDSIDERVATCLDWHRANGKRRVDWLATCRNWLRKESTRRLSHTDRTRAAGREAARRMGLETV